MGIVWNKPVEDPQAVAAKRLAERIVLVIGVSLDPDDRSAAALRFCRDDVEAALMLRREIAERAERIYRDSGRSTPFRTASAVAMVEWLTGELVHGDVKLPF